MLQVTCTEDYRVISPFNEDNLGTLHVEQTLRAIGIANAGSKELFSKRMTIIFDHTDDNFNMKNSPQHAKRIIDELCRPDDRVIPDVSVYVYPENTFQYFLLSF